MSAKVTEDGTIILTRGDSFRCGIKITDQDGNTYTPARSDVIRFQVKKRFTDKMVQIRKIIPNDSLTLSLDPKDTADLSFGKYVYDVRLIKADGTVDTFITSGALEITEVTD